MKILITGIGITGKSTLREKMHNFFSQLAKTASFDMDYDREKLPKTFDTNAIYIIEDVHGATKKAIIPLNSYDLILYLMPKSMTYFRCWFMRMSRWLENGYFAWDADKNSGSWSGTGKRYDLNNLLPILNEFFRNAKHKTRWMKEDLHTLKMTNIPTIQIIPNLKKGQLTFSTEI